MSLYEAIRDANSIPALKQALRLVCERVEALEHEQAIPAEPEWCCPDQHMKIEKKQPRIG